MLYRRLCQSQLGKVTDLRYGENPHQHAALYTEHEAAGIANARQLHGKEMSFNNYVDADAAWELVNDSDELAVAIIKHTNPSGVGLGSTNFEAYRRALVDRPVSAFGGIVAFNRQSRCRGRGSVIEVFSEVIVAPDYDADALEIFRLQEKPARSQGRRSEDQRPANAARIKQISGGYLIQDADMHKLTPPISTSSPTRQPTDAELRSMLLAWRVCKHVKSNAIVFANDDTDARRRGRPDEPRRFGADRGDAGGAVRSPA